MVYALGTLLASSIVLRLTCHSIQKARAFSSSIREVFGDALVALAAHNFLAVRVGAECARLRTASCVASSEDTYLVPDLVFRSLQESSGFIRSVQGSTGVFCRLQRSLEVLGGISASGQIASSSPYTLTERAKKEKMACCKSFQK